MTKDSIWAAIGPSGSLSDDTCLSSPSSSPGEEPSAGRLVLPGQWGSVALGAASWCGLEAFVEELQDTQEGHGA